ncbi:unnamed protein product [Kuraishia capsulata CBS 1993]|uniref:Geranylgeranyl transferase type-2 subunit beta n=1 Tax=Kuraishia capsulata CBS 1993 TaxID=1382522 RepID=W6MWI8_9ASCO|nr:uncharacterized protein KUCA_T00003483001 [Kuraishia capsulata CBS 1993]CDK27505.1 unnamed protein product [Kuraishia capsulata CBS 1993]
MQLFREKHVDYVKNLNTKTDQLEYWLTEHLRLNGVYWGLMALFLMDSQDAFVKEEVIEFVLSCRDPKRGGFGPYPKHEAHILSTLSAIQILKLYNSLDRLGSFKPDLVKFIKDLQLPDGSFQGDRFGEVDSRFVYTAIQCLSILEELDENIASGATDFVLRCLNFDGGFGMVPGAESHAAQAFVCLGTLSILGQLDKLTSKKELISSWLSERQVANGGLNGRPEKLPDVCYSWWVLTGMDILGCLDWVDHDKLRQYILSCQDDVTGGISDRPDNQVDVFHTVFGIAGLSLLGFEDLVPVDASYCLPKAVVATIKKFPYEI